ncbi:hypothetical protein GDO86_016248, partial [Hymenochirus boettgeri]
MPRHDEKMKIFVGNIDDNMSQKELTELFERYGKVVNCSVMKQYAFVHMRGMEEATKAIEGLNGRERNGKKMIVEMSKPRPQNTWKIFVGNVSSSCEDADIREIFEAYGRVMECDIVKDYAFVHMMRESEARAAIDALNGKEVKGKRINVEMSNKAQQPQSMNGSSHNIRSRRPYTPQSHAESYNHRRATEAAYASYALKSNYERYAPESLRYDLYESRPRQELPMYYTRDRSPVRRSPRAEYSLSQTDALTSKYRSELASYGSLASAYSGQASSYSSQRAYGSQASRYESELSALGTEPVSSYSTQASAFSNQGSAFNNQGSSISGTQSSAFSSSYGNQSSHLSASPYASSTAVSSTYLPLQSSAYETSSLASIGKQPVTTTTPIYERTRLSPPRTSVTDNYKTSSDIQRYVN